MAARQRLNIYREAYFYRLLDCLKEDYPATLAVLGTKAFQRLIGDYLAEFPPSEPSIFYAGQYLADFIAKHAFGQERPFLEDLARLERTTIEVFHGPDAVPIDAETMQSISADRWATLELQLHPAVKFLDVNWKVSEVLQATNGKREWSTPASEQSRMIVFRQRTEVYFRELQASEKRTLKRAREPVTFAEICEEIAAVVQVKEPAGEINRLFRRWVADGILVGVP
jgi:hypothetical protein